MILTLAIELAFKEHLLHTRRWAGHFKCNEPLREMAYWLHFTEGKTEAQRRAFTSPRPHNQAGRVGMSTHATMHMATLQLPLPTLRLAMKQENPDLNPHLSTFSLQDCCLLLPEEQ